MAEKDLMPGPAATSTICLCGWSLYKAWAGGDGTKTSSNKTLGRAQDPRANGAWLSKLTE